MTIGNKANVGINDEDTVIIVSKEYNHKSISDSPWHFDQNNYSYF